VVVRLSERDDAMTAGERIRVNVEQLRLRNAGNPPHGVVTVSVGITTVGQADLADADEAWISRADAALYRAKEGGRNRCEVGR
jgi:diguanylate cyclase (GGDEF)-like protein